MAVVVGCRNNDGKVYRVDIATAVADRKLETFTQQQLEELFEAVDPDGRHTHSARSSTSVAWVFAAGCLSCARVRAGRGWIEEEQALAYIKQHPELMNSTRKTALLQRFAGALVEEKRHGGGEPEPEPEPAPVGSE